MLSTEDELALRFPELKLLGGIEFGLREENEGELTSGSLLSEGTKSLATSILEEPAFSPGLLS